MNDITPQLPRPREGERWRNPKTGRCYIFTRGKWRSLKEEPPKGHQDAPGRPEKP